MQDDDLERATKPTSLDDERNASLDGDVDSDEIERHPRFVVGIGASAGGIDALDELLKRIPSDDVAFVVVQHLAPHRESLLATILSRVSRLEVVTITDGMSLTRNRVYVIPPNSNLSVSRGVFRLVERLDSSGPWHPIDHFFRSLAEERGAFAIGVILSGTGTDGTLGLKAIKTAGGTTLVQDLASAKHDGMPRSALASGYADLSLPLPEMARELTRLTARLLNPAELADNASNAEELLRLFGLIQSKLGNDWTHYKTSTVRRRVERRMALHKIERLGDYVTYVESDSDELDALHSDLLITVTSFFRDIAPFEALRNVVFPQIVAAEKATPVFRVWVPACATGEEAYSIAICLFEYLEASALHAKAQIFATDIDDDSIERARRGSYSKDIEIDVAPDRLARFFAAKEDGYQVSRQIREMVIFSKQNAITDAPFSRIDLVSCRNLLIYLKPSAQKRFLRIAHYSLNTPGFLMLGTSETVGDAPELFTLLDRKNKIYAKQESGASSRTDVSLGARSGDGMRPHVAKPGAPGISALADRGVLDLYGPPGVIINDQLEILHFRGQVGPYFSPGPGTASLHLLRVARAELHTELRQICQRAFAGGIRSQAEIIFTDQGASVALRLDALPIEDPETKVRYVLVSFVELPTPREIPVVASAETGGSEYLPLLATRNSELERELRLTKEYLQQSVDEREGANEELKAANEELQSANEELQSTNEELETSKEEMQSSNEELTTVNDELKCRMLELDQINDDLHNLLAGVDHAVIIVGMGLRIRRYTAAAEKLFNLVPEDIGRNVRFIETFVGTIGLEARVSATVESLNAFEEEILCANRRWYRLRISPYRTADHAIRGAVLVLTDIDVPRRALELTKDVGAYVSRFLGAISHPLVIIDARQRVLWVNSGFYDMFNVVPEETIGSLFFNSGSGQWSDTRLRECVLAALTAGQDFKNLLVAYEFEEGGRKMLRVGGGRVPMPNDAILVLLSIEEGSSS